MRAIQKPQFKQQTLDKCNHLKCIGICFFPVLKSNACCGGSCSSNMAHGHCHCKATFHCYPKSSMSSTLSRSSVSASILMLSEPKVIHVFVHNKAPSTRCQAQPSGQTPAFIVNRWPESESKTGAMKENQPAKQSQQQLDLSSASSSPLRIFVSTGDVMGDIHGGNLIKEIFKQAEESHQAVQVYALGGQRMKEAGACLIGDNTGLSSIGLLEALPLVFPSLLLQSTVRSFLQDHPPDILVLLDYPGVNIPFGKYVKQKFGCRVFYYIPPNEWLWNKSRSGRIVTMCDTILAVYPGEADYYASIGGNVELVGHPLIDAVKSITQEDARCTLGIAAKDLVVALLPASRAQELRLVWPTIAAAAGKLLKVLIARRISLRVQFIIPAALSDQRQLIEKGCQDNGIAENTLVWNGDSHLVMAAADVAITKSGSANLELALYNVPQVVVYKVDAATAWIARKIFQFSVKHISLVNLILNAQVVPEFIQEAADVDMIVQATVELLPDMDTPKRSQVLERYQHLRALLGKPGVISRAAEKILAGSQLSYNPFSMVATFESGQRF